MKKTTVRDIALIGVCSAILIGLQVAMAPLPNIEVVTLLIIVYTQNLKRKTLYIIYVFAIAEGLIYGFALWWVMYLYVWTILYFIVAALGRIPAASNSDNPVLWALVAGIFGLLFGAMCSLPYFVVLGPAGGLAYIISGVNFDLIHCAGNFVITLLLWKPLSALFKKIIQS